MWVDTSQLNREDAGHTLQLCPAAGGGKEGSVPVIACSLRVHSWRQTTSELNGSTSELSKSTPCQGVLSSPLMDSDVIRHVDTLVNYGSLLKTVHNELGTAEKVEL